MGSEGFRLFSGAHYRLGGNEAEGADGAETGELPATQGSGAEASEAEVSDAEEVESPYTNGPLPGCSNYPDTVPYSSDAETLAPEPEPDIAARDPDAWEMKELLL